MASNAAIRRLARNVVRPDLPRWLPEFTLPVPNSLLFRLTLIWAAFMPNPKGEIEHVVRKHLKAVERGTPV